jgi:hypothetical protein
LEYVTKELYLELTWNQLVDLLMVAVAAVSSVALSKYPQVFEQVEKLQ